jgi:hypothetical protein
VVPLASRFSPLLPKAKLDLAARHSTLESKEDEARARRRNYLVQALIGVALAVLTVIALS